ncbi:DEAD/DEAH box helicase [Siccirubricoccus deserti]
MTEDQDTATAAVLADLAAGRPMDRLVCGDVGFGKTEVALRAAAAAALSGHQVALLAPTTVLVRQHLESFRRRFEGLGIRVEALSRLTPPAEARAIRAAIAKGEVQIAIGTQALAAKSVRFHNLALLIIDEEQRFGVQQKAQLQRLRATGTPHVLTLTATPIPRTLQAALVGLRDLSVIATPPARRQPVRTLRAPLADALLAQALRREARRGGQSFVVCPRIEDVAPMRDRIAGQVPELSVVEAHGGLPPDEVDAAMLRFADGEADVLVSTNIVETGLDVPRANTMLVWRADRWSVAAAPAARPGRPWAGTRGDLPADRPRSAACSRYRPAAAHAGSAGPGWRRIRHQRPRPRPARRRRPAGGRTGWPPEAGGYRAVPPSAGPGAGGGARRGAARGLEPGRGAGGRRLCADRPCAGGSAAGGGACTSGPAAAGWRHAGVEALEDELEDRFGPPPEPLRGLFALARISVRCRRLGIARIEVGPSAAAATLRQPPAETPPGLELRNGRLLQRRETTDAAQRVAAAEALLAALAPARRRHAA